MYTIIFISQRSNLTSFEIELPSVNIIIFEKKQK